MEDFMRQFNRLQAVIGVVGHQIDFPRIVVVGGQSEGKSSVLESIVQKNFLPRGSDTVTRTPIELQLKHVSSEESEEFVEISYNLGDNSPPFQRIIKDFSQVSPEIQAATAKITGGRERISTVKIILKVFSPNVPDLTLVDLPGMIEVPIDMKEQIEQLILEYIEQPSTIILAVCHATSDLKTAKALSLAKKHDPEGKRTICVVTKLDKLDGHIDVPKLLDAEELSRSMNIKVQKVIGVINRSQAKIDDPVWTAENQMILEENYFRKYRGIAKDHGTRMLTTYLGGIFREHIRRNMPRLKTTLDSMVTDTEGSLGKMGTGGVLAETDDPTTNTAAPRALVNNIISRFWDQFIGSLNGDIDQGGTAIRGGSKIEELFNMKYWKSLDEIKPLSTVSDMYIWHEIRNSWGTERQIFLTTKAMGNLVRAELAKMKPHSLQCVTQVHEELLEIKNQAADKISDVQAQYPNLFRRISDIIADFLAERQRVTKERVEDCVMMQVDYINVKYKDFYAALEEAQKRIGDVAKTTKSLRDGDVGGSTNVVGNPVSVGDGRLSETDLQRTRGPASSAAGSSVGDGRLSELFVRPNGSSTQDIRWPAREHARPTAAPVRSSFDHIEYPLIQSESEDDSRLTSNSAESIGESGLTNDAGPARNLTDGERLECSITRDLVIKYFEFTKDIVRNCVPKVIMRFMVNEVKKKLLVQLNTKLNDPQNFAHLFEEPAAMKEKRKRLDEDLKVYKDAQDLVTQLLSS